PSSWCGAELWQADEVVSGQREGEEGVDFGQAPEFDLGEAANALVPAEDLFDALANDLADGVAGMARHATIDGSLADHTMPTDTAVDRDVRGHHALAQGRDEAGNVIPFVGAKT